MPKIIKDVRDNILKEAKKQILSIGYENVTVRSVVASCGISIGTFYNYFRSKDELVASFMLEDWILTLHAMRDDCYNSLYAEDSLRLVFEKLVTFATNYCSIFCAEIAIKNASEQFRPRHKQLRTQIADVIYPICELYAKENSLFLREYIAEAFVTWSVEGCSFIELWKVLSYLFKNNEGDKHYE